MDTGYTYSTRSGRRLSVYAPPGFEPPDTVACIQAGDEIVFYRLSDGSLECRSTKAHPKPCRNADCHRAPLGECQCGRHQTPVPFTRVVRR